MSHEIRTPMNGVLGTIELLQGTPLTEEQEQLVSVINESSQSMMVILDDILDFSKIESGQLHIDLYNFKIRSLLYSIVKLFEAKAEQRNLYLCVEYENNGSEWLRSDSHRIRQILSNLVSNTIKFTEHGGVSVKILVKEADAGGQQRELQITVKDTGIGIPKAKQGAIFELFTQADISTTRKFGGTGLGLNISRQLAHLLSGQLDLKSEEGQGTTITVTIPAAVGQPPVAGDPEHEMSDLEEQVRSFRILLVEDNDVNRNLGVMILKKQNLQVDTANNGEEAVAKVRARAYDIVFMDCHMPIMDGFEASRQIRLLELAQQPHINALTANVVDEAKEKCLASGMDDYTPKPIRGKTLQKLIRQVAAARLRRKDSRRGVA